MLRVGRGRVIRAVLVVVLLVLVWQTILSRSQFKTSSGSHQDVKEANRSPNLQVAAPVKETQSSANPANHQVAAPAQPLPSLAAINAEKHWKNREEVLRASDNINPRYNMRAVKDKLQDLQPKPVRNQHFLQQNQLNLMDDFQEEEDEDYDENNDDDDEEEDGDEGKWNGRNKDDNAIQEKDDNAENVAIEEKDDNADNADEEDLGLEDVGGEKLKKGNEGKAKKAKHSKKKEKNKKDKRQVDENDERFVEFGELIGERQNGHLDDDQVGLNDEEMDDLVGDEVDVDIKATEKELALRKVRVQEVCSKYGLGPHAPAGKKPAVKLPPTPNYDVFYIDRHEELVWCPIYKAASTSWLYNFLKLGGVEEMYIENTKEQVSHMARRIWPPLDYQDAEQAFKTCLKFMIVRHPFERLVSAYRDKLENTNIGKEHGVDHFYKKYGRKIVAKHRPRGQGLPARRYSQDMDDPNIPPPKGIEPTFEEFVKYLIVTDLVYYADDHWMPYYLHCTPCLLDYDVIAKFETLERDQNYIVKKKHLEDKIKPTWKHLTKGVKTSDTVRKYFATITKKDLMDLYDKYKLDFELFDYSMDEYLSYVRES